MSLKSILNNKWLKRGLVTYASLCVLGLFIEPKYTESEKNEFKKEVSEIVQKTDVVFEDILKEITLDFKSKYYMPEKSSYKLEGSYYDLSDKILIGIDDKYLIDTGLVTHELAHAFLDNSGEKKGLFYSEKYEGPNLDEILDYNKSLLNDSRLKKYVDIELKSHSNILKNYFNVSIHSKSELNKFYDQIIPTINILINYAPNMVSDLDDIKSTILNRKNFYLNISSEIKNSDDDIDALLNNFISNEKILNNYDDLIKNKFDDLNNNQNLDSKLKELINLSAKLISELHDNSKDLVSDLSLAYYDYFSNLENETMPEEIFARMVSSLYVLNLDSNSSSYFVLDDKDLDFLLKFKYNKKPMFEKGIDKYITAKSLLEKSKCTNYITSK